MQNKPQYIKKLYITLTVHFRKKVCEAPPKTKSHNQEKQVMPHPKTPKSVSKGSPGHALSSNIHCKNFLLHRKCMKKWRG